MDFAAPETFENLSHWLTTYGSFALFALLALEIIALPIPGETLMVLAGMFIHNEDLDLITTLIAGYSGSICGISISYFFGATAGGAFIKKYGSRVGLTETKMQKAHDWFAKFGKWTLIIGYFIPGVRHFTGFCAGMSKLEYKDFALFAYSGAFVWVTLFIFLGYCFGNYWLTLAEKISLCLNF